MRAMKRKPNTVPLIEAINLRVSYLMSEREKAVARVLEIDAMLNDAAAIIATPEITHDPTS